MVIGSPQSQKEPRPRKGTSPAGVRCRRIKHKGTTAVGLGSWLDFNPPVALFGEFGIVCVNREHTGELGVFARQRLQFLPVLNHVPAVRRKPFKPVQNNLASGFLGKSGEEMGQMVNQRGNLAMRFGRLPDLLDTVRLLGLPLNPIGNPAVYELAARVQHKGAINDPAALFGEVASFRFKTGLGLGDNPANPAHNPPGGMVLISVGSRWVLRQRGNLGESIDNRIVGRTDKVESGCALKLGLVPEYNLAAGFGSHANHKVGGFR